MNKKTTISLLGCGWLGLPLAAELIASNFRVKGSTTSETKLSVLKNIGIDPYLIALETDSVIGNISGFLEGSDTLIIDIPPKLRRENSENFVAKIQTLMPHIEKSKISTVLFISSTSVFADENNVVTESTIPNATSESGKQLFETEQLLQKNTHFKTTILRFGGLIGNERHPIKSLAGKENLPNPDAPINLIHQKDCIGIILKIISLEKWGKTYNAAAPFHPTRENFYVGNALIMNLPVPNFNHDTASIGKTIDSTTLQYDLNYEFHVPELF